MVLDMGNSAHKRDRVEDELDAMAIDGRLSPIDGTQCPRDDNSKALNDNELMDVFKSRRLAE